MPKKLALYNRAKKYMEISSLTDGGNKEEMVILIKNFGENDMSSTNVHPDAKHRGLSWGCQWEFFSLADSKKWGYLFL